MKKQGPRAFPVPDSAADMPGMTLRDYFAARALPVAIKYWADVDNADEDGVCFEWDTEEITDCCLAAAELAYTMADAMLKARAK